MFEIPPTTTTQPTHNNGDQQIQIFQNSLGRALQNGAEQSKQLAERIHTRRYPRSAAPSKAVIRPGDPEAHDCRRELTNQKILTLLYNLINPETAKDKTEVQNQLKTYTDSLPKALSESNKQRIVQSFIEVERLSNRLINEIPSLGRFASTTGLPVVDMRFVPSGITPPGRRNGLPGPSVLLTVLDSRGEEKEALVAITSEEEKTYNKIIRLMRTEARKRLTILAEISETKYELQSQLAKDFNKFYRPLVHNRISHFVIKPGYDSNTLVGFNLTTALDANRAQLRYCTIPNTGSGKQTPFDPSGKPNIKQITPLPPSKN